MNRIPGPRNFEQRSNRRHYRSTPYARTADRYQAEQDPIALIHASPPSRLDLPIANKILINLVKSSNVYR